MTKFFISFQQTDTRNSFSITAAGRKLIEFHILSFGLARQLTCLPFLFASAIVVVSL